MDKISADGNMRVSGGQAGETFCGRFNTQSAYSVHELIEFGRQIAAMYGPAAKCSWVINCNGGTATALVKPRPDRRDRFLAANDWVGIIEEAETDSAKYRAQYPEMTAGDLWSES